MRYGLVGTGHWATTTHAPAITQVDGAELVGVWGRDPAKAARVADAFACAPHDDVDALFEAVDAVAFAVPPHVQAELAVRAARAGCHLLLDKPVALDPTAADELVSAVATAGVATRVLFTFRCHPEAAAWFASTHDAGGWQGGHATWYGTPFAGDSPYRGSSWRREHGALWDLGPHVLSLFVPLLGEVVDVRAAGVVDGRVHATLVHAGGALSAFDVSFAEAPAADGWTAVLHGEAGWTELPALEDRGVAAMRALVTDLEAAVRGEATVHHDLDVAFGRDAVATLARVEAALGG